METRNETSQPHIRGQTSANKSESNSPPLRYVSFCFRCCTFPTRLQSHICLRTHTYCYQVVWANGLVPNILIRRLKSQLALQFVWCVLTTRQTFGMATRAPTWVNHWYILLSFSPLFKRSYYTLCTVTGVVKLAGSGNVKITVREHLGLRVTIRGSNGEELVRATRCSLRHKRQDIWSVLNHFTMKWLTIS